MAVNYEYYRCFYHVAKYKNLTRAASAMMSSQPNVTRVMRNLEQELGCRLITRSNRGITLTEEGERLYQYVAVAFEQLRLGEEALTQSGGLQEGSVSIGTSETAMHGLLLGVLRRFHQEYPGVRLKIRNYTTPQAFSALRDGQIDFAVITAPVGPEQRPFKRTCLKVFQDILIGGRQFAGLSEKPLRLADLAKYPLIGMTRDTGTFSLYSRFYMAHGLELDPDMEVATTDLILPMVENDLGLGFLPYEFAEKSLREGRVVRLRLEEPIPERHICLVQDTRNSLGPAARALRQLLYAYPGKR